LRAYEPTAKLPHMEPHKVATEAEVFERLKHDISRRVNNVCSEWSEADKEAIVDRIARTALRYPEIRDDPRFSR